MSDISQLERRITVALDRIRQGLDVQPAQTAGASGELEAALAKEKSANADLTERLHLLKERLDGQVAALTARVESQVTQMGQLDAEMQSLRAANMQLREMNAQLRDALTEGLTPEGSEAALSVALTSLKAERAAELAEMDAILAELKPLIAEH